MNDEPLTFEQIFDPQQLLDALQPIIDAIVEIFEQFADWLRRNPLLMAHLARFVHLSQSGHGSWVRVGRCWECRTWPIRRAWWTRIQATWALEGKPYKEEKL